MTCGAWRGGNFAPHFDARRLPTTALTARHARERRRAARRPRADNRQARARRTGCADHAGGLACSFKPPEKTQASAQAVQQGPITIYQSFEEYWEKNKIIYPVDVLELAFKKIAEKAWNSAMESAKERCFAVAMSHQKNDGDYEAGKKSGAFECADLF